MFKYYTFSLALSLITLGLYAQSGCPGCIVELPAGLPEDTIYLSSAAEGQVGIFYESDLGFRMPKTTTPVNANDPGTPPGLDINQITIVSVSNLPPGLGWEANQTVFDVSQETDGCVKICGVPLIPGFYNVEVVVSAEVLFVSQLSSFSFPIMILPGTSVTEGFTLSNNSGCGSVSASFTNNIPSGGNEGYSYLWDFGNGNMSVSEGPGPQVYDEPGLYEINYQAVIDTFGFLLTEVVVESVTCNDLFNNAPDIRIEVWNPEGERILETLHIDNAQTPLTFNVNLFIGEG
ncbi:MAG: PKD domain-containing protein, partial [Phaeodactylibacter sp.]|nr:PKD domain-containing protein [Phaeodactylibacter sp.]